MDLYPAGGERCESPGGGGSGGPGGWQESGHSLDDSHSLDGGHRVEVTVLDQAAIREAAERGEPGALGGAHKAGHDKLYVLCDSRDPDGPKLYFTPAEWEAFRLGVLDGEFDGLNG
ncbi:DUF397 domain-containing protein [Sphaerisporangium sp. NPDC049002]|uniref:DUF397 domain-containing protein n=1 Tax=unclassified Sphaerisporangium TaxID=2630420 RepID=UPI0033E0C13D